MTVTGLKQAGMSWKELLRERCPVSKKGPLEPPHGSSDRRQLAEHPSRWVY